MLCRLVVDLPVNRVALVNYFVERHQGQRLRLTHGMECEGLLRIGLNPLRRLSWRQPRCPEVFWHSHHPVSA